MPRDTHFSDYDPVIPDRAKRETDLGSVDDEWQKIREAKLRSKVSVIESGTDIPAATPLEVPAPPVEKKQPRRLVRVLKRGHSLSYLGLLLFTIVLYFRPYELFPALSSLDKLAYILAIATLVLYIPSQFTLEGNVTARLRSTTLVMLLAVAGLFSIPGATNPAEAWTEFNDVFIKAVLMFIVMVNVVRTSSRLKTIIFVALAVTLLLSVNAISDYRNSTFAVEGYRIKGLLGGMFGNPNDLALHFVTMTPIALSLMMGARTIIGKIIFGTLTILVIAANVVTYSRGGFLGLLAIAGVVAWKIGRAHRLRVAILLPVCIGLFITFAPGNYGLRVLSIFIPGLDPVGSSTARQGILDRSIIVSLRHPLAGVGMGNFHIYSLHETVTHNAFTQVSAEMGFTALIMYLMFLTGPIKSLGRLERETFASRKKSRYYHLAVGLQASLVGYMVCAFFAAVAYQWYAYYLVAYAVCLVRLYEADQNALPATEPVVQTAGLHLPMNPRQSTAI